MRETCERVIINNFCVIVCRKSCYIYRSDFVTLVNIIENVSPSLSVMRTILGGFNMFTAGRRNELDLEHYIHCTAGARVTQHVLQ